MVIETRSAKRAAAAAASTNTTSSSSFTTAILFLYESKTISYDSRDILLR
jgi:hypothetical protein